MIDRELTIRLGGPVGRRLAALLAAELDARRQAEDERRLDDHLARLGYATPPRRRRGRGRRW